MYVERMDDLESILNNMKFSAWRTWKNRIRYLIIVPRTLCNAENADQMFRVIWSYWILNAIILCSSDHTKDLTKNELYTYNPYSSDHSQLWKTVIQETVQVFTQPKNFSHSWHVFREDLIDIKSPKDCDSLFFDKTLNLDNYLLPINMFVIRPEIFVDQKKSGVEKYTGLQGLPLQTLAEKLRFNVVEVCNDDIDPYGQLLENGSYTGELKNAFHGLSNVLTGGHLMVEFPGMEMAYPHVTDATCFASRFGDPYPLWTNIFVAKEIWIGLGLITLLVTVVLYLHNKSLGMIAAFLDAERFVVGNSIIRLPETIKYRFTFGSIFLAFLVLDGVFRGRFVSTLASGHRYPNLDTLDQVKKQGVDIYGHGSFLNWFDDPVLRKAFHSVIAEKCLEMIALDGKQRACLAHCLTLPSVIPNSTVTIHKAAIPVKENYAVFVSTLNWPLIDRWNFEMQKLVEAGFMKKWRSDDRLGVEMESWKIRRAADQQYFRPIQLNTLHSAFVILFFGLVTALFTFLCEMKERRRWSGWWITEGDREEE
ncbi:uncharacterized protein LOC124177655 [Neodiprion fabricii]|uniref:uncharacterized protein LOC124177655 n=1 Tax=Neodiprion fabricii TaxID=2872261 RepID=UPI001ED90B93|nr:uncharacterized protein LOC124177655 [Neodiprion fabricii]XP_046416229.1 uncharacterized protein LOC124177655 [Neodiprion fabricii]